MRFFAKKRERGKLRTERRKALLAQDPVRLAEVAKAYLVLGDPDEAHATAKEGLRHFPASEPLRRIFRFAAKERAPDQLKEARAALEREQTAEGFVDLARAHRALREEDIAVYWLERAMERYPKAGRPRAELARIYEERFYQDLSASDARKAIDLYEQAVASDLHNAGVRFDLALLYYRIGETLRCRSLLREVTEKDVFILDAGKLLNRLCTEACDETDVDFLLGDIEESGTLLRTYPADFKAGGVTSRRVPESLGKDLEDLRDEESVEEVVLVQEAEGEDVRRGEFGDAIAELSLAAGLATRRLGLGALTGCSVEGEQHHVLIESVCGGSLGVLSAEDTSATRVAMDVKRYVETRVPAAWGEKI